MLNGETLFSFKNARGLAASPKSGVMPTFGGFAGILGFSARLTGGGMGDFGLGIVPIRPPLIVGAAATTGVVSARSTPGAGVLVDDLLPCCDSKPRTFPSAVVSTLSGDRDGLRVKRPLGGDLGEST